MSNPTPHHVSASQVFSGKVHTEVEWEGGREAVRKELKVSLGSEPVRPLLLERQKHGSCGGARAIFRAPASTSGQGLSEECCAGRKCASDLSFVLRHP